MKKQLLASCLLSVFFFHASREFHRVAAVSRPDQIHRALQPADLLLIDLLLLAAEKTQLLADDAVAEPRRR